MRALVAGLVFCTVGAASAQSLELFNGKNLDGWFADVPAMDNDAKVRFPFIVRDGRLVSLGTPGGHLITKASYENYTLEIKYRFAGKPGNCGVLVHASKLRRLYGMFPQSLEVQMMHRNAGDFWCIGEDVTVPDMVARRGRKETWGVDGDKNRRVANLTDDSEKPLGEWNVMRIECRDRRVRVWVNGDMVNDGDKCTASRGRIAIQAEGSEVEFAYLRLTPMKKSDPWNPGL